MIQLIIVGVLALALGGFIWAHDAGVRSAEAAKWKPKVEVLQKALTEQSTEVEAWKAKSVEAEARGKVLLAKAEVQSKTVAKKRAELDAIMAKPANMNRTEDCNEAESILDDYVDGRLRRDGAN